MAVAVTTPVKSRLKVGDPAPEFSLPFATKDSQDINARISSDSLIGKRYLVAFHPADWSDTCTRQFNAFRDNLEAFKDFGIEVLLVSGDYIFSRHQWAKKLNLPFYLLSDHKHEMGKAFGIYDEKTGFDARSVFLVGKDGRIEYLNSSYNADGDKDFNDLKSSIKNKK